ncbi:MAG: hypothetical protein ABII02_03185 [Candidatus Magasanikbacteria bacterium]
MILAHQLTGKEHLRVADLEGFLRQFNWWAARGFRDSLSKSVASTVFHNRRIFAWHSMPVFLDAYRWHSGYFRDWSLLPLGAYVAVGHLTLSHEHGGLGMTIRNKDGKQVLELVERF